VRVGYKKFSSTYFRRRPVDKGKKTSAAADMPFSKPGESEVALKTTLAETERTTMGKSTQIVRGGGVSTPLNAATKKNEEKGRVACYRKTRAQFEGEKRKGATSL